MITGKKIVLRAIEERDLQDLNRWSNSETITSMLGGWHFPSSLEDQKKWFQSLSSNSIDQRFAVEPLDSTEGIIGSANLVNINWKDGNALHGMLLGDGDHRGKGYAVDTVMTIMRYAFDELGLKRLDGSMIEYNQPSLNMYMEKCGWKQEGIQRSWYHRRGQHWDKVLVGVTNDDYAELIARTHYWGD